MQYLILAYDAPDALDRRMQVRATHLENLQPLVDAGRVAIGGVMLAEDGETIRGSMLVVEAEGEDAVRALVDDDVYTKEGVWERVEITPFRRSI